MWILLLLLVTRPIYTPLAQHFNLNGVWKQEGGDYHFFVSDNRVLIYRDSWIGRGMIDGRFVIVNWYYEDSGEHAFVSQFIIQDNNTLVGMSKIRTGEWHEDSYRRKK